MCGLRRLLTLTLLALIAGRAVNAQAGDSPLSQEIRLKAAYVLNFLRFTTWPRTGATTPVIVCVAAPPAMIAGIDAAVAGKKLADRGIAVRAVAPTESLSGCDALYVVGEALPASLSNVSAAQPMLTIGDGAGFVAHGGMSGLFVEQNRLRFSVNLGQARRAGLEISSGLLQLAASVENNPST